MSVPANSQTRVLVNAVAVIGVLLIMAAMIWMMYYYTAPPPVNEARAKERKTAREEIMAQGREVLNTYGWVDQGRGVARLSIARAMEITAQEWQDPVAGRGRLLARYERAVPPMPAAPPGTNAAAVSNAAPRSATGSR